METIKAAYGAMQTERQALQVRRSIVARRRELQAELLARKQNEERSQQAELQMRAQEDAQRKKKADALREAQERAKAEMDRKRKEENVKIVSSLLDRGVSIDAVSNYCCLVLYGILTFNLLGHYRIGYRASGPASSGANG
ncbi:13348_t:CDS:1 [Acaulospora colombiana]|uniref:13348_t:CDS:1 n=1 Tax=Acaulospora colombiana TaxID=27376 RepID=A0ACA9R449_9GLOM|nr:13348_t:CDS:1 [Acaulospora colombiana]